MQFEPTVIEAVVRAKADVDDCCDGA
jgi:hypothetical protein